MALIGYARVSTGEQDAGPQVTALTRAGCGPVFAEQASGASRARPELARCLAAVGPGDVLVVVRIDRLARSLAHLLALVADLERRGAGFRSLGDPIDTTSPQGRFALQILGAVAEFERALIRERTRAGLAAARALGRTGGNPGVRAGDPAAIRQVAAARDRQRDHRLIAGAQPLLECLRDLRPGQPWDAVVRRLNALKVPRPGSGDRGTRSAWTRDSLIRAARRLVRAGLLDATCLDPAPRRRTSDDLVPVVAGIVKTLEREGAAVTLAAIGRALEDLGQPTPRGGRRWSRGSVQPLLERARSLGLVAAAAAA